MDVIRKCGYCQKYKVHHKPYGHLPPKNVSHVQPWDKVYVDMIGPWKVIINNFEYQFRAVTCIDSIINLPEVIPVDNAKSKIVANAFEDGKLSRYPRPRKCIHDNGNEFLGPEFMEMLAKNNIQSVPTTIKNPQSNAVVERLHQTLKTTIAISLRENPPNSFEEVSSLIHRKCASAQFAIRATIHSHNKMSPGEMAFGRHMLYPFSKQIDWQQIMNRKQKIIDVANIKENAKRKYFDYKVGDLILILNKQGNRGKLEPSTLPEGPWKIVQIHTNGTVSILRNKYVERLNIRRIRPFFN